MIIRGMPGQKPEEGPAKNKQQATKIDGFVSPHSFRHLVHYCSEFQANKVYFFWERHCTTGNIMYTYGMFLCAEYLV